MPTRRRGAAVGCLSIVLALALGDLAGRVYPGSGRPLVGVGEWVIDRTPASTREALIGRVGTADKPLLLAGITLTVIAMGTGLGVLARRRAWPWPLGVGALAVLTALAVHRVHGSSYVGAVLVAATAALAASYAHRLLTRQRLTVTAGGTVAAGSDRKSVV